jgi:hypothetical protein
LKDAQPSATLMSKRKALTSNKDSHSTTPTATNTTATTTKSTTTFPNSLPAPTAPTQFNFTQHSPHALRHNPPQQIALSLATVTDKLGTRCLLWHVPSALVNTARQRICGFDWGFGLRASDSDIKVTALETRLILQVPVVTICTVQWSLYVPPV